MNGESPSVEQLNSFIDNALAEDLGSGDHSSLGSVPEFKSVEARMIVKDVGVIAGIELAQRIFSRVNPEIESRICMKDGERVEYGNIPLIIRGNARSILAAERVVLNCVQRMSGIATYTRKLVDLIAHTSAKVLDTRKTTPGFRLIEKWAVRIGGGTNHRFGLYDLIMLKDNHIDYAGGIRKAIASIRAYMKMKELSLKIEIETRNLNEVEEVLSAGGVDIIMLDNMDVDTMRQAVKMINRRYLTEASGGITERNIVSIAETGVDFVSVGALTHSYKSLDISLKASL